MEECSQTVVMLIFRTLMLLCLGYTVTCVSATDDLDNAAKCRPQHVHLSYGEARDQINVVWATEGACAKSSPLVKFGIQPWQMTSQMEGKSEPFPQNLRGLQNLHRVTMKGLQGGTNYFYRPLSEGEGSGPFYFRTPAAGADWSPEMLVVGSFGEQSELLPVLADVALSGRYDTALQLGGLSHYFSDNNSTRADAVMRGLEEVATRMPYMTALGENETEDGQYTNYRHRFSMPGSIWPIPEDKLWYSFNHGPAHFVSFSTDIYLHGNIDLQSKQNQWLEQDLSSANAVRDKWPWIVAFGHHPFYCLGPNTTDCALKAAKIRANLEDKMFHYRVDIVLQDNDDDSYYRLFPVFKNVVLACNYSNPRAPVQIVLGTASPSYITPALPQPTEAPKPTVNGSESGDEGASKAGTTTTPTAPNPRKREAGGSEKNNATTNTSKEDSKDVDSFAFQMVNGTHPTYGHLQIVNATHAHWELLAGNAFTGQDGGQVKGGDVLDSLWIVQEKHEKFELKDLPSDVTHQINQNMVQAGEKPGELNVDDPEQKTKHLLDADNNNRIIIGASFGGFILVLALIILFVRLGRQKRRRVARRWDAMDYKYGKTKLYNAGHDEELDEDDFKDEDNDFEVDIPDGSQQTTKLINGK